MRKRQDRHSQRECKKWALQIPPETRHVVAMDATQHVTYVGCLFFAFRRRTGRWPDATWTSGGETEAEKTRNRRAGGRCANRGGAWPRQQKPLGAFVTGRCRPEQEVADGVPHGPDVDCPADCSGGPPDHVIHVIHEFRKKKMSRQPQAMYK